MPRVEVPPLQFLGVVDQLGDAGEEASGGAAVEDAVVEAQGEHGHGRGDELLFLLVPRRLDAAGAKAALPLCLWPTITGITGLWALIGAAVRAAQSAPIIETVCQHVADRIKHRSHRP